ncbi:hypothetical protein QC589_14530 [Halomonas elongata]
MDWPIAMPFFHEAKAQEFIELFARRRLLATQDEEVEPYRRFKLFRVL